MFRLNFLLFFFILGCNEKIVYLDPKPPSNQANALQSNSIDEEIEKLEKDFDEQGTPVNLKKLPIVVSSISNLGECHYNKKGKPIFIVLDPKIFSDAQTTRGDEELNESLLFSVLLHEVGHCYFNRKHETNQYVDFAGQKVSTPLAYQLPGFGEYTLSFRDGELPVTAMMNNRPPIPRILRKYYIAEIAGLDRMRNLEDLKRYTDIVPKE